MKSLVITSCTAKKKYSSDNPDLKCFALEMYQGIQHLQIKEAYKNYCKKYNDLDLVIISAGYGLLESTSQISSYDISFNEKSDQEIQKMSQNLHITEDLNIKIKDYDLIFICLGLNYLKSIDFSKLEVSENQKFVIFSSFETFNQLTYLKNYIIIKAGKQEAIDYSYGIIGLKGYLFKLICEECLNKNISLNDIYNNPKVIENLLIKYKKSTIKKINLF